MDIIGRIYEARIIMMRSGRDPEIVYLGYEDERDLYRVATHRCEVTWRGHTTDDRTKVFDMPVYVVDAPRYIRVV
jgi:hypothetical protein